MAVPDLPGDGGEWWAIRALAAQLGVSRQALQKRVKPWIDKGLLPSREENKALLVHRPTFQDLDRQTRDPAQGLRNRQPATTVADRRGSATRADAEVADADGSTAATYERAAAREKNAKAEIAELKAAQMRGDLVPTDDVEAASTTVAETIAQAVSGLKSKAGDLYAAAMTGGEREHRARLAEAVDAALAAIVEQLSTLAVAAGRAAAEEAGAAE